MIPGYAPSVRRPIWLWHHVRFHAVSPLLLKHISRESCRGLNGKHPHVVYLISWLWQEIFTAQCNLEYKIQIRDPMSKYLPEMLHAILVCRCRSCAWDLKSPLYLEHLTATSSSSEDSDWQILNIVLNKEADNTIEHFKGFKRVL